MESVHSVFKSFAGSVVDEGGLASGHPEKALDRCGSTSGEMLLELHEIGTEWEIAHPKSMTRLSRFPWWTTKDA